MQKISLESFVESVKTAVPLRAAALRSFARTLGGGGATTGALVGGGLGALSGAAMNPDDRLGGAIRGGVLGGLGGGLGGGAARAYQDTRLLHPTMSAAQAVGGTAARAGQGLKRFAQRQLHGFTGAYGKTPGAIGLRSSEEAANRIGVLQRRMEAAVRANPSKKEQLREAFKAEAKELKDWGRRGDEALAAGITNLPGVARGMLKSPVSTAKVLGRASLDGGGAGGAALALGVPVAVAAPDLMRGDERHVGGRSLAEKATNLGAGLATGALTAGLPVVPMVAGGALMDTAAESATRRVFGRRKTT